MEPRSDPGGARSDPGGPKTAPRGDFGGSREGKIGFPRCVSCSLGSWGASGSHLGAILDDFRRIFDAFSMLFQGAVAHNFHLFPTRFSQLFCITFLSCSSVLATLSKLSDATEALPAPTAR